MGLSAAARELVIAFFQDNSVCRYNGISTVMSTSQTNPTETNLDARPAEPPRGFVAEWTVTIILLLFGTTSLVQAFVIPTGSMEDTLLVGDHLLVDKLAFAPAGSVTKNLLPYSEVHRGDIIVFRYPIDIKQTFVKRAMGVAGDRIRLENKKVFLNGHMLNEPYVVHKLDYIDSYRDNFPTDPNTPLYPPAQAMLEHNVKNGEVIVPPGFIFAMGDNRDQSLDSRYWGFVPRENIIGKPLIIYWSYDATTEELSNPAVSISHLFDIATHFLTKTRWNRSLNLIRSYPVQ
jgi:signal peptidase I